VLIKARSNMDSPRLCELCYRTLSHLQHASQEDPEPREFGWDCIERIKNRQFCHFCRLIYRRLPQDSEDPCLRTIQGNMHNCIYLRYSCSDKLEIFFDGHHRGTVKCHKVGSQVLNDVNYQSPLFVLTCLTYGRNQIKIPMFF